MKGTMSETDKGLIIRIFKDPLEMNTTGTFLVVQWLRLHAPNAEGPGLIPDQGTRSHMHAATKDSTCCNEDPTCHN